METVRLQTVKIESAEAENAALREQVAGLVATLTKADSAIWTAHGCALKLKAQMNGRMMYGAAEVDWWVDAIDETYALRREMRATTDRASKALSALPTTPEAPQDRSLPALEGVRAARMRPAKPDEMGD